MARLPSPSRQTPYSGAFVGLGDIGDSCRNSTVWEDVFSQSFVKHIPECLLHSHWTVQFMATKAGYERSCRQTRTRTEPEQHLTSVEIAPNVLSIWP